MCQASPHTTHTHHHNTTTHTTPHVHTQPTHHTRHVHTQNTTHHTTHQTTDRDLESVFVKRKVNAWTRAQSTTTHGDLVLEARVDFLAVLEHRLIPARVRSEWARLDRKDLASIWAPPCQDSSHVGDAGVYVISMRGALVALPSFATSQFKMFF